jgi:DNA-binding NarL/FixJ family response regulator
VPRILIVDEYAVSRAGLHSLVEQRIRGALVIDAPSLASAAHFFDGDDAFDLVLIDYDTLSGHSRDSLARSLNIPKFTRIAITSAAHSRDAVLTCLVDGFHGFIDRLQPDHQLMTSLNDICNGRVSVPPWIADGEEGHSPASRSIEPLVECLTPRQRSVLSLIAQGLSNKEIAHLLHISEGTTKVHTAAMLRALGARNRTEAAAKASALFARETSDSSPVSPPLVDIPPLTKARRH